MLDSEGWRFILESLFRPAVTGIVKDDAAPPHPVEVVNKFLEKKM